MELIEANYPTIFCTGGLDIFYDKAVESVKGEVPDLTTGKGRKRIASLAASISSSKAAVEGPGRKYNKHLKSLPKVIDKELREFCDKMDALRDETRLPLTQWQEEQDRIEAERLAAIEAEELRVNIIALHELALLLDADHDRKLAEIKAEAERKRIDHEEAIAKQAALTAVLAIEREKQAAIEAAIEAKNQQIAAEQRANIAAEHAERRRIDAEKQAAALAEQAVIDERQRADYERQALAAVGALRESDKAHRAGVKARIIEALVWDCVGITEAMATDIFEAIDNECIPGVSIHY